MINSKILVSLLATASLLHTGCASKINVISEESLEHQSPVTYIYNKNDKVEIIFNTKNNCENYEQQGIGYGSYCELYHIIETTCDFSSSSECKIVTEAGALSRSSTISERDVKTYLIDKNQQKKGDDEVVTFVPKKYINTQADGGFFGLEYKLRRYNNYNKVINVTDYISNPVRISFSVKKEFISKYNQESILGNFVRHGLIETNSLKAVTNKIPLKINLGFADVYVPVQTYAYKNGTMVSIDNMSIQLNGRNSTINLNTIKQETVRIIENAVNN